MLSKTSKIVIAFTFVIIAVVSVAMPALAQTNTPPTPAESTFDWSAIYPALQNLLILLLTGLGSLVARWVNAQYHLARGKLDENQIFMLDVFIRTMVYAAEQLKLTQVIDSKLDWVTEMAQDWCDERGIAMSLEEIR